MGTFIRTILLTFFFSTIGLSAHAASGPVTLNTDVSPGTWKGIRLKNLPKAALVAVDVESNGEILVALVDARDYQQFPNMQTILLESLKQKPTPWTDLPLIEQELGKRKSSI
jgi:hypothetical protein